MEWARDVARARCALNTRKTVKTSGERKGGVFGTCREKEGILRRQSEQGWLELLRTLAIDYCCAEFINSIEKTREPGLKILRSYF